MDSAIALPAGLEGVNLADIALKLAYLTAPGIALERGLKRFRTTSASSFGGGQAGGRLHRLTSQLASFVTLVALLAAGLGLVPLAKAIYELVSGVNQWAPGLIGVALLALLARYGWQVVRGLMDGKVDRWPWVWLALAPLVAMVSWTAPMVWDQITSQAGQTVQMIMDRHSAGGRGHHDEGSDSTKEHKNPSHTDHNIGRNADH